MLRVILCTAICLTSFSALALDHTIGGRQVCSNPSCTCVSCDCERCECGVARETPRPKAIQVVGKPKPANLEGQRFLIVVDQSAVNENYCRALAKDNGYRLWIRESVPGLPPGIHEAEIYQGQMVFSEPKLLARPVAKRQAAVQPVSRSATYDLVGSPAAPQGYTCGPNGCFPNAAPAYQYSVYQGDGFAGSACEGGNCGAAAGGYSSWGGGTGMFGGFFGGGSSSCSSCGS